MLCQYVRDEKFTCLQGGAFPEIHVAQYPLEMGRPGQKGGSGGKSDQTLALTVNAEGEVNYDAVIKQGKNAQKWIASTHGALVPKVDQLNPEVVILSCTSHPPLAPCSKGNKTTCASGTATYYVNSTKYVCNNFLSYLATLQSLQKPDEEAIAETAKETAEALQRMVEKKIGAENPKTLPTQPGAAQYIKYTPSQQNAQHNSGASTRIIKMQDMPVDPLDPPKFRSAS